jgi:hypothetical protein
MTSPEQTLNAEQQRLNDLWDQHLYSEFALKDASAAVGTMVEDAYVNHVPVLTGVMVACNSKSFIRNTSFRRCLPIRKLLRSPVQ